MIQSLYSASSGMMAQQMQMDSISNNLANVNTPGYKKSRVEFQDLLYSQMREPGMTTKGGQVIPNGIQVGTGTRASATQMIFEQGSLQPTGNDRDFAISGDAFFEVLMPDGTKAYTRSGSFTVDADGYLVDSQGHVVNMEAADGGLVTFGTGTQINIDSKGTMYQDQEFMRLEGYSFDSPADLEQIETGIFRPSDKSGEAILTSEMTTDESEEEYDEEGNPLPVEEKPKPQVYYQVVLSDGETGYTADNSFKIDSEGRLVTIDKEYPLDPEVTVDISSEDGPLTVDDVVSADADGVIKVPTEQGRLNLVRFTNPAGLEKIGGNLYVTTANSGNAQIATDFNVVSGSLEMSNVQLAEEMVNMIMANRAYELGSRSIKTSDDMLGMANSMLRR